MGPGLSLLLCNVILLIGWAWTGGFVVGSVSRRTVWVSAILSFAPCVFCLERFRAESLSRLCLLLFLPTAIWGVRQGLQIARIKLSSAIVLAVALTALTIPTWSSKVAWIPNWALIIRFLRNRTFTSAKYASERGGLSGPSKASGYDGQHQDFSLRTKTGISAPRR